MASFHGRSRGAWEGSVPTGRVLLEWWPMVGHPDLLSALTSILLFPLTCAAGRIYCQAIFLFIMSLGMLATEQSALCKNILYWRSAFLVFLFVFTFVVCVCITWEVFILCSRSGIYVQKMICFSTQNQGEPLQKYSN